MYFIRLAARSASLRFALHLPRAETRLPLRAGFSGTASRLSLTKDVIESRVLNVLRGFEKVDPIKVF
jgi:hypothetical protein